MEETIYLYNKYDKLPNTIRNGIWFELLMEAIIVKVKQYGIQETEKNSGDTGGN